MNIPTAEELARSGSRSDRLLTAAQRRVVFAIADNLWQIGGDSALASMSDSPRGDGRWVSLADFFSPETLTGARRIAHRLHQLGVLKSFEIAYHAGFVKAVPAERIDEEEAMRR